jgi:hypothetical protein
MPDLPWGVGGHMGQAPSPVYALFRRDGSGQYAMYRTTNGDIALPIFDSEESGERYLDGKGLSADLEVVGLSQIAAAQWLRGALKDHRAKYVAKNPDPAVSSEPGSTRLASIFDVLVGLESTGS